MASPDLERGAINAARRAPTQNRADVSEGMRAEISQQWKQWGKWLMSTLSQDCHLKRWRWDHGGDLCREGGKRGVGPSRGKETSNFQDGPATQRHGSRQPLEQTSVLGRLEGFDQILTSIDRKVEDLFRRGKGGWRM